ncbi:hypothetical protein BFJ63_vAg17355 [Fusarium oxysporum f. sp. narcissi]|uniref:Methyltransferase domain-containing protein n=1 Tax=Fusarium oxysporum f. sp. narcissi TaxID=451672 RepID=A0A4Q2V4E9_FUSOX|nr:hypothetical protein BFJ63_vAg17355 [Fusarium oxysporum f. sp. narcissi]
MSTSQDNIIRFYAQQATNEDNRLLSHPMERELTLRAIQQTLEISGFAQSLPKRIVDIGGGTGRLAFRLADEGYHVDLIDLSPGLVHLAQTEQERRAAIGSQALLKSINVGNALDKPTFPENSYDAVLLLGPLYHLLYEPERIQAIENAIRIAKPQNGFIFCAFISREAHLRDLAMRDPARIVKQRDFYDQYVRTFPFQPDDICPQIHQESNGTFLRQLRDGRYQRFNETLGVNAQSFHATYDYIEKFFQSNFTHSTDLLNIRSTEGILGGRLDQQLAQSSDEVMAAWADLMFENYSTNAQHLGCADHLLVTLRKK